VWQKGDGGGSDGVVCGAMKGGGGRPIEAGSVMRRACSVGAGFLTSGPVWGVEPSG
jgi:hypothetical protein